MTDPAGMPIWYGAQLGHAAVQWLADAQGFDVLHIKGAAVDQSLLSVSPPGSGELAGEGQPQPRNSTDADILVRPTQAQELVATMLEQGWRVITDFETGSAFQHAASLWQPYLGYVDVHRRFPGIGLDPEEAFDVLWAGRGTSEIAHRRCQVPSLAAQRVLLLLHTARGGRASDKERAWDDAEPEERLAAEALVARLKAEVAFAAATGGLDRYADAPDHDLWELYSTRRQADRLAELRARLKAAGTVRAKARLLVTMLRVNRGHLEMELGHQPSRRELLWAARRRVRRAIDGLLGRAP